MRTGLIAVLVFVGTITMPTRSHAQAEAWRERYGWVAGALTTLSVAPFDTQIESFIVNHRLRVVDDLAQPIGEAGSGRFIIPAIAAGVLLPRLVGANDLSNSSIDIGLGYLAASGLGGLLRVAIGRHRPDETDESMRFSPFRLAHEWHSLPSGHMVGVMSLATGISMEARSAPVTWAAYSLATVVGLQRIYKKKHWPSDVLAGSILGIAVGEATIHWRMRERAESR